MTTYVRAPGAARAPVQSAALLASAVFLPAGVLGFVPGITAHYGSLGLAAHDSGAELLGLFQVSVVHNLLHLALGLAGFAAARTATGATAYLLAGGAAQLVLWLYGLTAAHTDPAEAVPVGTADDGLRLLLAAALIALGVLLGRHGSAPRADDGL